MIFFQNLETKNKLFKVLERKPNFMQNLETKIILYPKNKSSFKIHKTLLYPFKFSSASVSLTLHTYCSIHIKNIYTHIHPSNWLNPLATLLVKLTHPPKMESQPPQIKIQRNSLVPRITRSGRICA